MRRTHSAHEAAAVSRLLSRLDALATTLAGRGDVVAVLGLGSAGEERERLDAHSDLDVFVIVEDDAATRYRRDSSWWGEVAPVAFAYPHTHDGWKVLFEDGVFVESAFLTVPELHDIPFAGARTIWRRVDAPEDVAVSRTTPTGIHVPSDEHQVAEALTNLFVGLHRHQRGEMLSATRLIQVHAVDRILTLLERTDPSCRRRQDIFAIERSAEVQHADRDLPLGELVPGYGRNTEAATAVLAWLRRNASELIDAKMAAAVQRLLDQH